MSAVSGTRAAAGRLRDYLQRRRGEMRDLLERLVRAESPSTVPAAQEPVLDLLENALMERGYRIHRLRGHRTGGHLFATPGNRSKNQLIQLLIGHCDTVWPLGTLDTMPVRCRDGKLYGPGAYDMKAGLVQGIFALEALKVLDLQPGVAPVFFINSDEEIGSGESTPQIRRLARSANRAFVLEPSLGPKGKLKTQRKGVGRFIVRVVGKAAHAGLAPEQGASAILELSFVIQQLFALNDVERGITVNVGTIDGGIRPNVVAPESHAVVDVRVLRQEDEQAVAATIRGLQPTTRELRSSSKDESGDTRWRRRRAIEGSGNSHKRRRPISTSTWKKARRAVVPTATPPASTLRPWMDLAPSAMKPTRLANSSISIEWPSARRSSLASCWIRLSPENGGEKARIEAEQEAEAAVLAKHVQALVSLNLRLDDQFITNVMTSRAG